MLVFIPVIALALCGFFFQPTKTRLPKQFTHLQGQLYSQWNKLCGSALKIHEVKYQCRYIRISSITYVYMEFSFQTYTELCTLSTKGTPSFLKVTRVYTHTLFLSISRTSLEQYLAGTGETTTAHKISLSYVFSFYLFVVYLTILSVAQSM
jgi:hypothetical protein